MPDKKLYNIAIRYSLHYLVINEWYRHQNCIIITKKINICIARFELTKFSQVKKVRGLTDIVVPAKLVL